MNNSKKHFIVIADDDVDDREAIKEALIANNCQKEFVMIENGEQLLEYLYTVSEEYPELILLDLNMPIKDGKEALREIKKNKLLSHIPIVVFTTSSSDKDRKDVYELGANCYITKPNSQADQFAMAASLVKLWLM